MVFVSPAPSPIRFRCAGGHVQVYQRHPSGLLLTSDVRLPRATAPGPRSAGLDADASKYQDFFSLERLVTLDCGQKRGGSVAAALPCPSRHARAPVICALNDGGIHLEFVRSAKSIARRQLLAPLAEVSPSSS